MTQRRTAQAIGTRSLIGLLLLAVLLLGLSVARQQALGPLHQHAKVSLSSAPGFKLPSTFTRAASGLAQDWLSRWRQQQVFGHGQVRVGLEVGAAATPADWTPNAQADHDHHHHALERHHHSLGDNSVIALDGAAEAADTGTVGAALLLPMFASPSAGLALASAATRNGSWPICGAVRFATQMVAPLLRPPTA